MSVTCTPKRLETHLAFVTQTSAMALARQELEEGTGELFSLYIFDFLSLSVVPYLQVGRDLWDSKMINLGFDNDLQSEHSWNSLLILHPEQFMSSFQ